MILLKYISKLGSSGSSLYLRELKFLYEGNYSFTGELRDRLNALLIIEPDELLINNLHEISIEYIQK